MGSSKVPLITDLNDLIKELQRLFLEDHVDVDYVQDVMLAYHSNPKDWKKYAFFDRHRYTRNLVDDGNGKYNLMILCWSEGQGSAIHDHPSQHCIMKILSGTLTETRFAWPTACKSIVPVTDSNALSPASPLSQDSSEEVDEEMRILSETDLHVNDVAYMSDDLGLHRMENRSHVLPTVSLHLYVPPYESCRAFDQRTGHATTIRAAFHSEGGKRILQFSKDDTAVCQYENNWRTTSLDDQIPHGS